MQVIQFSRWINRNLIAAFDSSKLKYMLVWFPIYQIVALYGVGAIVFSLQASGSSLYLIPLSISLVFLLGVPILISWHLSAILFAVGYFGFFARLGIPAMSWVTGQLLEAVDWYRLKS